MVAYLQVIKTGIYIRWYDERSRAIRVVVVVVVVVVFITLRVRNFTLFFAVKNFEGIFRNNCVKTVA